MDLGWATEQVRVLLELRGAGERQLDLVSPRTASPSAAAQHLRMATPELWFPGARLPEGAVAGLWLYFGAFDEAHGLAQDLDTAEGSYWHAIVHRLEPDAWNSGYWFRRVGKHAIFPALLEQAKRIAAAEPACGFSPGTSWNPAEFTAFCERARALPGSSAERAAREIQTAEWRLLFAWCGIGR